MLLRALSSCTFKRRMSKTLNAKVKEELVSIAKSLSQPGKGYLAADESPGNIGKKLEAIKVENTKENRRLFRQLLFTTEGIDKYISGAILFDSTVYQKTDTGVLFPQYLKNHGVVAGIKVDKGLEPLAGSKNAFVTKGLEDLDMRCAEYKKQGCHFTKWRCVFRINQDTQSYLGLKENSEIMARYAEICQLNRLVPIVEPEVLPLGNHNIKLCQKVTEDVLSSMFRAFHRANVYLEGMILKSNMVTPGQDSKQKSSSQEIGALTVKVFQRTVPPAVPIIVLLSGGQSEEDATINLNAICQQKGKKPWFITFCYGRALQASAFKAWLGKKENVKAAQKEFTARAKANGAAALGKYKPGGAAGAAQKDELKVDGVHEY